MNVELSAREKALILICLSGYLALIQGNHETIDAIINEAKVFAEKHPLNVPSLKELIVKFISLQNDPVFAKLF